MNKDVIVAMVPGTRRDLLKLFQKHQISGVPVVKAEDGRLIGLVTSKDLFRHSEETQLAMIMTKNPVTVLPETSLCEVISIMVENRYHRIIVAEQEKVVGIITPADILPHMENSGMDRPVEEYVKKRTVPVFEETPVFIAWKILKISGAYALPVLGSDGKIAGIVTDRDFFRVSSVGTTTRLSSMGLDEDEDMWSWESLKNLVKVHYEVSDLDLPTGPLKAIMIKNPMTVLQGTPVWKAAQIMNKFNIRILPISDAEDNLIASISDIDVISAILD